MGNNNVEQNAIDITRLTNSREVVACVGMDDTGTTKAFRSTLDSIDAIWKCINENFLPVAVAYYATVKDGQYEQGGWHYIE